MHKFNVELWGGLSVEVNVDQLPSIQLDGQTLDARIVRWAVEYGFRQGIRDAGAQGKDDDARNAGALKRIDALVNNTLRDGGGATRLTPVEREMLAIAEGEIRDAFDKPENADWVKAQKVKTGLGVTELRAKATKAHLAKDAERIRGKAEENLAKRPSVDIDLGDIEVAA